MRTEQAQLKQARLGYGPSVELAGGQEFRTGDNTNAYETYAVGTTSTGETQITQTHHFGLLDPVDSFLASSANWLSDEAPGSVENSGIEAAANGNHALEGFQAFMYTPTKALGLVLGGLVSIPRLLTNNEAVPTIIHALSNPVATVGAVANSFGSQSLQDKTAFGLSLLTPGGFSKVSSLAGDIPKLGRFLGADVGWSSGTGVTLTTTDGAIYGSLPSSAGPRITSGPIGSQVGAIDVPGFGQIGNRADSFATNPNYVSSLPFSYKEAPFQRFVQRFGDEFSSAGFDDAQGFMQGSAASGVKYETGEMLDARMGVLPSDYDVAVVSPKLAQRAQELGLNVFDGPLTVDEVGALGLTDAQNALSAASKYQLPVNFKIYDSAQAVFDAQKTIPFSDWVK